MISPVPRRFSSRPASSWLLRVAPPAKYLFTGFDLVVGLVVYVAFAFFVGAVGVCS